MVAIVVIENEKENRLRIDNLLVAEVIASSSQEIWKLRWWGKCVSFQG